MRSAKELRDLKSEELDAAYHECCQKRFEMRNGQVGIGDPPKPSDVQHVRKEIARIRTVLRERELAAKKSA